MIGPGTRAGALAGHRPMTLLEQVLDALSVRLLGAVG